MKRLQPNVAYYNHLNIRSPKCMSRNSSKSFSNMNSVAEATNKLNMRDDNNNMLLKSMNKENELEITNSSFNRGASYLKTIMKKNKASKEETNSSLKTLVQAAVHVTELTSNASRMLSAPSPTKKITLLPNIHEKCASTRHNQTSLSNHNILTNLKSHFHFK